MSVKKLVNIVDGCKTYEDRNKNGKENKIQMYLYLTHTYEVIYIEWANIFIDSIRIKRNSLVHHNRQKI